MVGLEYNLYLAARRLLKQKHKKLKWTVSPDYVESPESGISLWYSFKGLGYEMRCLIFKN
jgi:hypothetical protein